MGAQHQGGQRVWNAIVEIRLRSLVGAGASRAVEGRGRPAAGVVGAESGSEMVLAWEFEV